MCKLQQTQTYNHLELLQALGTVHIPDATPESELSQVLAILGALAAENDKSTLMAVLQGLSPQVLSDCVIANMAHLPPATSIVGTGTSSGLAGLMQVGSPGCHCFHIHRACRLDKGSQGFPSRPLTLSLSLSFSLQGVSLHLRVLPRLP